MKWHRRIPGFRSGKRHHQVIASVVYACVVAGLILALATLR